MENSADRSLIFRVPQFNGSAWRDNRDFNDGMAARKFETPRAGSEHPLIEQSKPKLHTQLRNAEVDTIKFNSSKLMTTVMACQVSS